MKTLVLIITAMITMTYGCESKYPPPPTSKQLALLALSRMSAVAVTYKCKNNTFGELKIGREFMYNVYAMDNPPKKHIRSIKQLSAEYYYCVFGCMAASCKQFSVRVPDVYKLIENR